jgi:hypothetical protein
MHPIASVLLSHTGSMVDLLWRHRHMYAIHQLHVGTIGASSRMYLHMKHIWVAHRQN